VLSYSIYIWQTLFLHVQNSRVFAPLSFVGSFPANWLGFYALACFSYYVIEQPSLQLRRRLIGSLHIYAAKRQSARSGR
jgi:peptidoglycan/LPS O-acetylase OafA/YrhL